MQQAFNFSNLFQSPLMQELSNRPYTECGKDKREYKLDNFFLAKWTDSWNLNRKITDYQKVEEIMKDYNDNYNSYIGSTLSFFMHGDRLYCFDGNHRRVALINLYNQYQVHREINCVVIMRQDLTEEEIKLEFYKINRNTPIPDAE